MPHDFKLQGGDQKSYLFYDSSCYTYFFECLKHWKNLNQVMATLTGIRNWTVYFLFTYEMLVLKNLYFKFSSRCVPALCDKNCIHNKATLDSPFCMV